MGLSPQPSRKEFLDLKNIRSFNKYLLSAYQVPDATMAAHQSAIKKKEHPCPPTVCVHRHFLHSTPLKSYRYGKEMPEQLDYSRNKQRKQLRW